MRKLVGLICFATLAGILTVEAKTLYVSQKTGSNSNNGLSESAPKATIQAAIGAAASGDTIVVGPGVYADDEGLQNGGHWWGQSRIKILNKALCIKSSHGPDVTHIVGKRGDTPSGYSAEDNTTYGTDVARCVIVQNAYDYRPVVIQGFTLRGGSTHNINSASGRGGALMDSDDGSNSKNATYIVDCVISNCQGAVAQIAVGGTFVRCRIQDNVFVYATCSATPANEVRVYQGSSRFLNCLFWRNKVVDQSGATMDSSVYWADKGRLVNCTIAANRANFYSVNHAYFYNTVYALNRMRIDDGSVRTNQVHDTYSTRMMINPLAGDFRFRKGSSAASAGDAQYIASEIPMPDVDGLGLSEDFRVDPYKDLFDNPIPTTGAIACGAVQQTAEPAAGALVANSERVLFPGMSEPNYAGIYAWMWPTTYPTTVKIGVAPADGNALFSFTLTSHGTGMRNTRYPLRDEDALWFIPPPSTNAAMNINFSATANVKWVDCENAADAAQDGSPEHPYAVIQDAVDSLGADSTDTKGVIFVKPGVYSTGGAATFFSQGAESVNSRVRFGSRYVRLVSTDGPEKTVILGAADPSSADGCGQDAYMTISMSSSATVQGFTLTGGHSGGGGVFGSGRGSLYSYGRDLCVTDCIITNNTGRNHAIGTARFERCLIAGNKGGSGLSFASILISCLVGANDITGSSGYVFEDSTTDHPTYLVNTTAICDGMHNAFSMISTASWRLNSIVYRGLRLRRPADSRQDGSTAGCLYCGFADNIGTGYTVGDPMLRDPLSASSESDFALYSLSPAFTAGVGPAEDPSGLWWYLCTSDYYGNPWEFDSEGRPVAGAVQEKFSGGAYVGNVVGGVSVSGGTVGYNALSDGETLTVGIESGGTRPIAGFEVNGVTNLFVKGGGVSVSATKSEGVDIAIVPITTSEWYVDAADGDDLSNTGYCPASAFKTLERAMTNSCLYAYDTVKALPGTYEVGEMYQSQGSLLPSRVVVPANVALESTDGPSVTRIRGRAADAEIVPTQASYVPLAEGRGMGTNAVRCAFLNSGASICGFTLEGGHTRGFRPDGTTGHGDQDTCGGCLYGGTVRRSVLTGGVAFRGGGAHGAKCIDCVFDGNTSMYGGGATSDSDNQGCLSRGNECLQTYTWGGFFFWKSVDNCTVLDSLGGPNAQAKVMRNTLVLGKIGLWSYDLGSTNFSHCAVAVDAGGHNALNDYGAYFAANEDCIATEGANLRVDESGRPVVRENLAIDAGDATISPSISETDLSGVQRVYNGALDIGALEADWRGAYGLDIGRRGMTVLSASEDVVESQEGTVRLPPGQSIAATWDSRNSQPTLFELPLRVTGSGTLTVTVNGETRAYTAVDGVAVWRFTSALAASEVSAVYEGADGYGELLRGSRPMGTCVILH